MRGDVGRDVGTIVVLKDGTMEDGPTDGLREDLKVETLEVGVTDGKACLGGSTQSPLAADG